MSKEQFPIGFWNYADIKKHPITASSVKDWVDEVHRGTGDEKKEMVGTTGFEPVSKPLPTLTKPRVGSQLCAQCPRYSKALEHIIARWDNLPERVQQALLAVIEATSK